MSLADDPTVVPVPTPTPSASETPTVTDDDGGGDVDGGALERGAVVGRYLVLEEIGAGAMGRVYAAYDPRLDRKVALKLIRGHAALAHRSDRATARLLAEAQALARLAHPNVVGVHDVELVGGAVAIAMEFVAGTTLRGWLQSPRPWREILRVFQAAGAGLAAAHRAGVIHRDFKPDNVMLGDDGRARVVDFGLARADAPSSDALDHGTASGDAPLSETSATAGIVGTPAYMAPELYGHGTADARSDQFSFCVALYEALHGRRPFGGNSLQALAANVVAGRVLPPLEHTEVPTWLQRVVLRGLAADPHQRHADMDELLAALGRDPSTMRRQVAFASGALGLFAIGVTATWGLTRPSEPCAKVGDELVGIWDDDVRERVADAFTATGVGWAEPARVEVERRLDAFTGQYLELARDNCMATHVRREQSPAMLDLRTACLAARRRELAATTRVLAEADADVAREAVRVLEALGRLEVCGDLEALRQALPPPEDPQVRAQVDALRGTLAEIDVNTRAGRFTLAHQHAVDALAQAEQTGYPPLLAEARYQLGYLQDKVGDSASAELTLTDAALLAERVRHDVIAARALADAVFVIGSQLGRVDEALIWARYADAAAARTGDELLTAKALTVRGMVLQTAGRLDESEAALRAGLEIRERLLGERHIDVTGSLLNLAVTLESQGRDAEAVAMYERTLAIDESLLGPDHPRIAGALNNMVSSLLELGRADEALARVRRAERIYRAALPGDHPNIAAVMGNLGAVLRAMDDLPGARAALLEQLAINTRRFGEQHPDIALSHHNLAAVDYDAGEPEAAARHFAQAIDIYGAALGPDHPEIAGSLSGLGEVALDAGRNAEARGHFERAVAILERAGLEARIELPIALRSLAESHLALGDAVAAETAARRAIELFAREPLWADRLAHARWVLAKARRAQGHDAEALASLREAADGCHTTARACAGIRADLERWTRAAE